MFFDRLLPWPFTDLRNTLMIGYTLSAEFQTFVGSPHDIAIF
jgi:hypothetical protein